MNLSDNFIGTQWGLVLDIAMSEWFYIQPCLMYIQKGMTDSSYVKTPHYIEFPLLLSFKFSALRLDMGPYFGLCIVGNCDYDIGLSTGIGFDIGMFYIGAFYDYGLNNLGGGFDFYNRTLGLNVGVNL